MRPDRGRYTDEPGAAAIPAPGPAPAAPRCPPEAASNDGRVAFEDVATATILKPGDKVLLVVSGNWTMERVDYAQKLLGERFPDAEFTFVSQVDTMIVKPADD
jgi:phosphoketolase